MRSCLLAMSIIVFMLTGKLRRRSLQISQISLERVIVFSVKMQYLQLCKEHVIWKICVPLVQLQALSRLQKRITSVIPDFLLTLQSFLAAVLCSGHHRQE